MTTIDSIIANTEYETYLVRLVGLDSLSRQEELNTDYPALISEELICSIALQKEHAQRYLLQTPPTWRSVPESLTNVLMDARFGWCRGVEAVWSDVVALIGPDRAEAAETLAKAQFVCANANGTRPTDKAVNSKRHKSSALKLAAGAAVAGLAIWSLFKRKSDPVVDAPLTVDKPTNEGKSIAESEAHEEINRDGFSDSYSGFFDENAATGLQSEASTVSVRVGNVNYDEEVHRRSIMIQEREQETLVDHIEYERYQAENYQEHIDYQRVEDDAISYSDPSYDSSDSYVGYDTYYDNSYD